MDALIEWLPRIGAILMLIIGLAGFFKPQSFTANMGIELTKPEAWAEMRTVMGGINIGYALAALAFNSPMVYMAIGLAWSFGIVARLWSMLKDDMTFKRSVPGFVVDGVLAFLFLSGLIL
jgi:hypothetical protein